MSETLKNLPRSSHEALLVGYESSDDAAVYRMDDGRAIVSTVDFITPPVDDPRWFGRIAAANSISDVYAMGAKPLFALNLVMFPVKTLGSDLLAEILAGAAEKVAEAGAVLAGGHSVEDPEPKFGLCVTGAVDIPDLLTNAGAAPGDVIVLTKPLGTGVLFNAVSAKAYPYDRLEKILPEVARLNGDALTVLRKHGVHALTDVSGFGLAGHLREMARGSDVTIEVSSSRIPLYPDAVAMYGEGQKTGSNAPNREYGAADTRIEPSFPRELEELLFDPQTSGGLLAAMPGEEAAARAVDELKAHGYSSSAVIGTVVPAAGPRLIFT